MVWCGVIVPVDGPTNKNSECGGSAVQRNGFNSDHCVLYRGTNDLTSQSVIEEQHCLMELMWSMAPVYYMGGNDLINPAVMEELLFAGVYMVRCSSVLSGGTNNLMSRCQAKTANETGFIRRSHAQW